MHNGNGLGHRNGHGNGNSKRWLLIGLLVLGGFWLVNDSYSDGYRDALVQTGQAGNARFYRGGPDFPWGLIILGGIGYVAWRKGAFDRFNGPDNPFGGGEGNSGRDVQRYGGAFPGQGPAQGFGGFRGPRAVFEEWHRESHEAERSRYASPQAAHPSPPAPQPSPTEASGNGAPQGGYAPTPPPPPPAPEYWASMTRTADAASPAGNAGAPVAAPETEPAQSQGATGPGPALERW